MGDPKRTEPVDAPGEREEDLEREAIQNEPTLYELVVAYMQRRALLERDERPTR